MQKKQSTRYKSKYAFTNMIDGYLILQLLSSSQLGQIFIIFLTVTSLIDIQSYHA